MGTLVFEPLVSMALWLSLVAAAVALLGWYAVDCAGRLGRKRAARIVLPMAIALALPLTILLNPIWHDRVPPPEGKPLVTVLVDTSASMATDDAGGESATGSRFDAARRIAQALTVKLADRFELHVRRFDSSTTEVEPEQLGNILPTGQFTDFAGGIADLLGTDRPQGQAVVLLSDGIQNVGGEAAVLDVAERARALTIPVFAKTLGGQAHVRDLAVDVQAPQDLAFVNQRIPIRVGLDSQQLGGAKAHVVLSGEGKEVAAEDVTVSADGSTPLEFRVSHGESGVFRYEITAAPLDGEVTDVNNNCTYVLRVIDEPIRVLLLEGKPYWDTKFLVRMLSADPSMELVSIVRLAEDRYLQRKLQRPAGDEEIAAANPLGGETDASVEGGKIVSRGQEWEILSSVTDRFDDAAWLNSFQIVCLGRDAESYLTDDVLAQLKRWLAASGGSLVCFRGTPTVQVGQRLGSLLPVRTSATRETRFHVKLTDAGKALGWIPVSNSVDEPDTLSRLPSLATRSQSTDTRPLAVVFAVSESVGGPPSPVVTSIPYGTGRVVVLEGAGMWRWAFLPPQFDKQEQIYAGLWQSLTRWLVSNTGLLPTQTWALRSDKVRFATSETATASLLVRRSATGDKPLAVELTGSTIEGAKSFVPAPVGDELDAYRVVFGRLPEGRYQAKVTGSGDDDSAARTVFDVRPNVDEVLHLAANENLMSRLAEGSGGSLLETASPEEVAAKVEQHLARARPEQFRQTTAWDRWWVLLGVFALWGCAWGLRRHQGLV